MSRRDRSASASDAALRARLRGGDPLASAPEREALARLAGRVATLAPRPSQRRFRLAVLLPAAAAILVLAMLVRERRDAPDNDVATTPAADSRRRGFEPATAGGPDPLDGVRQLQFETPGGTRVVWMLDPNLAL